MRNNGGNVYGGNVVNNLLNRKRAERRMIWRKGGIAAGIILGYVVFQTAFAFMVGILPR